ncbi:metallophosphoesterase [Methanobrevibacter sp. DSM 116169]|uniref:metallophosphoesterase n=1 Tax=Methanobrevibacter sp. DSM 116169 TaxID=3242727 RepID=UPI0038FBF659
MLNKLINFKKEGNLLVVTDLHGNLKDYNKYIDLWDCDNENNHILFVGDLIHAHKVEDKSIEILNDAIEKLNNYNNFHVLLGNHEWCHITDTNIFKEDINQTKSFKNLIKSKYGSLDLLNKYVELFKLLPIAAKTDNGIFISHAGPTSHVNSLNELEYFLNNNNYNNKIIDDLLWARPEMFYKREINNFLNTINCKYMVVGHTPVDGVKFNGNQLIVSSSFDTKYKAYLDIDLKKEFDSVNDFFKCINYI